MKDVPPLRECGRGTDAGTVVDGPARGSWNHRAQNAAINPIVPPRRRQNGQGQGEVPEQGSLASRQGHPGSVPQRKDRPHLQGHGREPGMDLDKRRPQAPGVEAGITGTGTRSLTRSCPQGDARMGKARGRFLNRGLWLHPKVIPAAFPAERPAISGAMDVNMDRQREPGMDLDKRRPQAPGV